MSLDMEKQFYSVMEVAKIIGLGKNATYKLVKDGVIPHVVIGGIKKKVSRQALEAWCQAQKGRGE